MTELQRSETIALRAVAEWEIETSHHYDNPFVDVRLEGVFTSPSGKTLTMAGFYDGGKTWRLRFNPGEAGEWSYLISSTPYDAELICEGEFTVTPGSPRGFLRSTPGEAWGFHWESGEPAFLLGDTVYNLFGMAHCGVDVEPFLRRRAEQGFNLLRIRVPVSSYHPGVAYHDWAEGKNIWPWGGSPQCPSFDQFNLDYFQSVDRVVREAERLGLGIEMIMQAWPFEFPFNDRRVFVAEWEELWMRYLIARYDAFNATCFWTPMNEYEFYPDGIRPHTKLADLWMMRMARLIKTAGVHGHIVALHPNVLPDAPHFRERFLLDPSAIDTLMLQQWGGVGEHDSWLATGIEDGVAASIAGWPGTAVLSEYGYERLSATKVSCSGHRFLDENHTRRGAWRGVFSGLGVIHGFDTTWGPWAIMDRDLPGLKYLLHLRRFVTEIIPFSELKPSPDLLAPAQYEKGCTPLILASDNHRTVAVYFPAGGTARLQLPEDRPYAARWFNPRTGELSPAPDTAASLLSAPAGGDPGRPDDWIALLTA